MAVNRCGEVWGFLKELYVPFATIWQVDYDGNYFPLCYQVANYSYNNLQAFTLNTNGNSEELQITRNTVEAFSNVESRMNMVNGQVKSDINSSKQT